MTRVYLGDYVQGRFAKCKDPNGMITSLNPGDLNDAKVPVPFSYESIYEAVTAARTSFTTWRRLSAEVRIQSIVRYAGVLKERARDFAKIVTIETGRPLWETTKEVEETLALIDHFVSVGSQTEIELKQAVATTETVGVVRFFPRGAFAVISPHVQPVLIPHSAIVPALINGNTIVLKSSSHAPFTAQLIAEIMHQSGMPSGVFNLVHGHADSARRLVAHDVDGIFFSGSTETGLILHKQLSDDFGKTLVLEVGGKNSTIIWNDANYLKALHETLFSSFVSSGQRGTSNGRIFVHDRIFDTFLKDFHGLAKKCPIGYGLTESPFLGPLVSEKAVENYLRYQGMAVREGCEEIMRGKILEREKKGYYVSPSIHLVATWDSKSIYQQNEVFGPDVAIHRFKDIDEVLCILNVCSPTLVTSVYSSTREAYQTFIDGVHTGILNWNLPTTEVSYQLPYGSPAGNFRPMGSLAGYQCAWPVSSLESRGDFEIALPEALTSLW